MKYHYGSDLMDIAGDATKLDYSDITVELRTVDGLVKERTQCAPNGYYFIPVYDKGSFVIKINGPEGWSWDPEKFPVVVDEMGCNRNEDINFRFTGFTISGRVVGAVGGESCSAKNGGPSNVNVELLSPNDDLIYSIVTSPDGSYLFKNVIPGKYKVRASHPDLKVEVRGSAELMTFSLSLGYDLHGFVVAQGNPILGVHIYLYSNDVEQVECPQGSGEAVGQRKPLCHAVTNADGMFRFKSLPCGRYELVPSYKGENTVFDVSPPLMSVSVEHQHITVSRKVSGNNSSVYKLFEASQESHRCHLSHTHFYLFSKMVTGFSVGGRIVDGNGMGVEGVKIIVDGHERSATDKEGNYKLDKVTSNRYTIEAKKEHYKFNKLKEYMVLPNMASIPDITAISYDVCGVVSMIGSGYTAKVALTHGPENAKPQVKQTDGNGNFCFEVSPGEYRLSALAVTPDSAPGLLFSPPYVDVMVKSPLLDVQFTQALVNVRGSVTCKEKCGPLVSITLVRLAGIHTEEKKSVSLTNESDEFLFQNVAPGKYRLEVKHGSSKAVHNEDNWCWEQSFIDVDAGAEDPDGSPFDLKIKKGSQNICMESPGVHELHLVNSFDTSNPLPINLKGEKYLLKGQIRVELGSADGEYELPNNIIVDILNSEGNLFDGTAASLVSHEDDQTGSALFEYSVWANLGEKLTFVPRDPRNNGEKKILFYPREQNVLVANDGCQSSIPPSSGRMGLYIEGSVSPPLSGVHINIIASKDSKITSLKKDEISLQTATGLDGSFLGGPLYDDITYRVEASKPGYHLKRVGPHSFSCQKLGQISVHIYSKDDTDELIPSVLLSLSGDDGYRNNSISGAGGAFRFDNLFPGTFYLRPLLKEYAFSPSAQVIELGSGESREVTFQATRVAYSATGTVTLLSGQPKEGVSVEARSVSKGYYEETVTDSSGSFRLRGLVPETTYAIKVVKKDGLGTTRIERASPESVTIQVGSGDIRDLDFVVFEQPEVTILSCHVEGRRMKELQSQLLVVIKSASDAIKTESVFELPMSNFFQVKNLPKTKHLLQLRTSLQSRTHKFESEIIEVDLERTAQIHVGPLRYSFEEDHQKQELTPAPVFPLIVGVSVIALFITMPRLKDLYQATVGIPTPGFMTTAKREPRKPAVRKKSVLKIPFLPMKCTM
ncbi:NODAL MODULATOR 1-RELATED, partial [Salix purpurea]